MFRAAYIQTLLHIAHITPVDNYSIEVIISF